MNDKDVISKRLRLERLRGAIIDEIYDSEGVDGIEYEDCVRVLLQVIDLLQVQKGHKE